MTINPQCKPARLLRTAFVLLLLLFLLPAVKAQAATMNVKINTGASLESTLLAAAAREGEVALDEIDRINITGNGKLTEDDGLFVRQHLPGLRVLNLRGFTGSSENGAFRGCISLQTVMLPERFVISREMFYGCTSLEEVVWPVRYQLTRDCFAYCALDFSSGYPNLLNDRNVLTYAANQRPKVYFTLPRGERGSIGAGGNFTPPYELRTRSGGSYMRLIARRPNWLLTRETELEVSASVTRDGERLDALDTDEAGRYEIVYSLPYATYADTRTQTYILSVLPSQRDLSPLIREAAAKQPGGYTAESWQTMQEALTQAEELMDKTTGVHQTELDTAREALNDALAGLQVKLEGAPTSEIYVGSRFTLTPAQSAKPGQNGWQWDEKMLSASFRDGGAEFTALQAGETEITFTADGGEKGRLALVVLDEGETTKAATLSPEAGLWTFAGGLYLAILLAMALVWFKQQHAARPKGGPQKSATGEGGTTHG